MVDERTTEALLEAYKPFWSYVKTDRNGTRYFMDTRCPRCAGHGRITVYSHVDGGVCFECGGVGRIDGKLQKVYTKQYSDKLQANREARARKAEAARTAAAIAERPNKLRECGFGQDINPETGKVEWVIYRVIGDTYPIKDALKALGCRFNSAVGWYANTNLENYRCQRLTEEQVLEPTIFVTWKSWTDISPLLLENIEKASARANSEWQGDIGGHFAATLKVNFISSFPNNFGGTTNLIIMSDEHGNIFKWSTTKTLEEGQTYCVSGTIKDHSEYKGAKQTVVTRCKVTA